MVNVDIFYDHLEYFGIIYGRLAYVVCGHLLYLSRFGMFGPRKIWQPWCGTDLINQMEQLNFYTSTNRHRPRYAGPT
jgi:hypothetical protein